MLKLYLKERLSWILLTFCLQMLLVLIAYLDPAISIASTLYYVFLSTIVTVIFLFVRYRKETRFYQQLIEQAEIMNYSNIPAFESPLEKITAKTLIHQLDSLNQQAARNQLELEQEKDDHLSWIHEVKTPLTAIRLMIDRIEDPALKKNMTFEWLRIHLLLDQQLHQKRIPFMENDLYIETADLEALIFGELKTLQSWCIQKGIGFEIDLRESEVMTDAKWLGFILRQLLTNAVKYSDSSDIYIRSFNRDGHLVLEIEDFGRGIDPRDMPRIFEKGFTSTVNHQDKSSTGMGLFLAQKAASTLKIDIQASSRLGSGTTFTLTFPASNEFTRIMGM